MRRFAWAMRSASRRWRETCSSWSIEGRGGWVERCRERGMAFGIDRRHWEGGMRAWKSRIVGVRRDIVIVLIVEERRGNLRWC